MAAAGAFTASAQPVTTNGMPADLERGTYANYFFCQNPAYAIFSHFDDASGSDSRLAQLLIGWNTSNAVPVNQPLSRYLIRRCRVTITLNNGNQVAHDPSHDDYRTNFDTNHVAWLPDSDIGRPIELFGVGYRHGYTSATFSQCSTVGNGAPGTNNVFGVTWTTNGVPVDVGNDVGKTLPAFPAFESWPFAVAQTTNCAPGELMPANSRLTFELNLDDPFVVEYLQRGLQEGRPRFMVSSLHQVSGQFGSEPYPSFTTRFNQAVLNPPTTLDLDVMVVRDIDSDSDGLPDDWEQFYFTNLVQVAEVDTDGDGASNQQELLAGTNPALASSVLRIVSKTSGDGRPVLHWPNLPSRTFTVQRGGNPGQWQSITNPPLIYQSPGIAEWTDGDSSGTNRFYRVRVQPE